MTDFALPLALLPRIAVLGAGPWTRPCWMGNSWSTR